jgi:hypothetical protein
MVGSKGLGADHLRGLMAVATAITEWMRVVDTISLRGRGGREADRSGRTGDGESWGLAMGRRRSVGRSDLSRVEGFERWYESSSGHVDDR